MKSCIYCGNALEDHAQFCSHCGQNQNARPQPPQYQTPYGQNPYQAPHQPAYAQPRYDPVSPMPFKPPVGIIGVFILLGAIVAYLMKMLMSTVMVSMGFVLTSTFTNLLFSGFYTVIFLLITFVGFVIYNNKCRRCGHHEKKLSILWLGLPWLLRSIFGFIFGFIWGILYPILIYDVGLPMEVFSIVNLVANIVIMLLNALFTWLLTVVILKSVVKGR